MDPVTMALISAGITGGGSIASKIFGDKSEKKAMRAQLAAMEAARANIASGRDARITGLEDARGQIGAGADAYENALLAARPDLAAGYDGANEYLQPYYDTGVDANETISDALGLNGIDAQQGYYNAFADDPGFEASLAAGREAIERSAAARGGMYGGGALKELHNYGQRAKLDSYRDRLNRLSQLSQTGYGAASQMGQYTAQKGSALYDAGRDIGANRRNMFADYANIDANIGDLRGGYYDNQAGLSMQGGDIRARRAINNGNRTNNMIEGLGKAAGTAVGGYGNFDPFGF